MYDKVQNTSEKTVKTGLLVTAEGLDVALADCCLDAGMGQTQQCCTTTAHHRHHHHHHHHRHHVHL